MWGNKHLLLQNCGKEREVKSRNEYLWRYKPILKENEAKKGKLKIKDSSYEVINLSQ